MLDFVQRRLNGESTRRSRRSRRREQEELRQRMTHLGHLSAASRRRQAEERRQAEAASRPTPAAGVPLSWPELVRHAYASGSWSALGLPSADEVAALVDGGVGVRPESRNPAPGRKDLADSSQEAPENPSAASQPPTQHQESPDASQAVGTPGNTVPGPSFEQRHAWAYRQARADLGLPPDPGHDKHGGRSVRDFMRYAEEPWL